MVGGVGEGVVTSEAEGVVKIRWLDCGRLLEGRIQVGVGWVVEVIIVMAALVVVLVVVAVVLGAAKIIYIDFLLVLLPVPVVSSLFSVRRVVGQVGKSDPIQLNSLHPLEPLSSPRPVLLFDLFQQGFEHKGAAAEEDSMVLEQDFEGFAGNLAVDEEVLMVEDQQDRRRAGLEVLQVAAFNAQSTQAPVIVYPKGIVVDLSQVSPRPIAKSLELLGTRSRSSRGSLKKGKAAFNTAAAAISSVWAPTPIFGDAVVSVLASLVTDALPSCCVSCVVLHAAYSKPRPARMCPLCRLAPRVAHVAKSPVR